MCVVWVWMSRCGVRLLMKHEQLNIIFLTGCLFLVHFTHIYCIFQSVQQGCAMCGQDCGPVLLDKLVCREHKSCDQGHRCTKLGVETACR